MEIIIVLGLLVLVAFAVLRMAQAWEEYTYAVRRAEIRTRLQEIEDENQRRREATHR